MDKNSHKCHNKGDQTTKLPTLFAWIASAAVIALIVVSAFINNGEYMTLKYAGTALLLVAGVLIFTPFYQLKKYGKVTHKASYLHTKSVADQGLYAIVRHPQYLGYCCLAAGFALLSQHIITSVLAGVCISGFYLQAVQEENHCRARFGHSYETYCQYVPRFNIILGALKFYRNRYRTPK